MSNINIIFFCISFQSKVFSDLCQLVFAIPASWDEQWLICSHWRQTDMNMHHVPSSSSMGTYAGGSRRLTHLSTPLPKGSLREPPQRHPLRQLVTKISICRYIYTTLFICGNHHILISGLKLTSDKTLALKGLNKIRRNDRWSKWSTQNLLTV